MKVRPDVHGSIMSSKTGRELLPPREGRQRTQLLKYMPPYGKRQANIIKQRRILIYRYVSPL